MTFSEIASVLRVVGIGVAANLHMASDRDSRHPKERDRSVCEHPVAPVPASIVSVLQPLEALLGMSSFGPAPCHTPDRVVDVAEDLLADDMAVVVAPAPDDRVETTNQGILRQADAGLEDVPNLLLYRRDTGLGRFDEQLAVVLADIEAEEVEALIDMDDSGLLLREFQPAFPRVPARVRRGTAPPRG